MTKCIFCKQAYVLDKIRLNMSYSKAVREAVRDFNSHNWTKECDGREVIVGADGSLRCGIYTVNRHWCIEVKCDDN